ncbi:MAG: hypothetical protein ABI888_02835 [Chloroflexota bacterium]
MAGPKSRWALAAAVGAFTTALAGGVAFASFQAPPADQANVTPPAAGALADRESPRTKIKAMLDALVAKGTITRAQEDAILKALDDQAAAPKPKAPVRPQVPTIRSFSGGMTGTAATYLGQSERDLAAQLRAGKSIAAIAAAQNKSVSDLAALLTKNASDKIDRAVAANKLTTDQAAALKTKIAGEVTRFLQHSFTKPAPRPAAPVKPSAPPTP